LRDKVASVLSGNYEVDQWRLAIASILRVTQSAVITLYVAYTDRQRRLEADHNQRVNN